MSPIGPVTVALPPVAQALDTARVRSAGAAAEPSPLWNVLTDEERSFFLASTQNGPLSYGPAGNATNEITAPVGQRLDVRG